MGDIREVYMIFKSSTKSLGNLIYLRLSVAFAKNDNEIHLINKTPDSILHISFNLSYLLYRINQITWIYNSSTIKL